jgi:ribosome biogenesis GTPase / thiamine phosphate phosphatase
MKGLVLRSTGSWYDVMGEDNQSYACRTKGKLRLSGFNTTNPIAVGDIVIFDKVEQRKEGIITAIEQRRNYIIRRSIKNKNQGHIIASNLDQTVLVATLTFPKTSLGFIDRFLVSAEAFRIPQVIIFNKTDLLSEKEREKQQTYIDLYTSLGVNCLEISALQNEGVEKVLDCLRGKKSLLSGHSGVGKSTLLNCIAPELDLKTSEVSDFAKKGVHTTTFAEMFEISKGTFIIDTPGIKELGLMNIDESELSDYFPEMRALIGKCKFHNCLHTHEPGCAIKKQVGAGIAESRYKSYLSMLDNDDNRR